MSDFEVTNPHDVVPGLSKPRAPSELSSSLDRPAWVPPAKHARRRRARRLLAYRRSGRVAATGQKVTVEEKSSTTYEKGTTPTSAKAVAKGQSVLVLGTVNSTTITATQVVVGYKSPSSATSAARVVPFTRGKTTASTQVRHVPANWSAGPGSIVSGTTAAKATEAALAAYPGAIVDRVAKLSNGEYNVHYIGVNWPHHVFESSSFTVTGAL